MESFMRRVIGTAVIATAAIFTAFTPAQGQMTKGIFAGVNSSSFSVTNLDSDESTSSHTGFMAGGWIGLHLGNLIALQLEAFYTQKGSKLNETGEPTATFKTDYIEIPLLLQVGLPLGALKPHIYAGPAIAFNVNCKIDIDGGTGGKCDEAPFDIEIKSTDFSGIIGIGINISRFLIAVQYDHGFDNLLVDDTSPTEANNRTWTLLAGFGL
jgi:hypothetical protein